MRWSNKQKIACNKKLAWNQKQIGLFLAVPKQIYVRLSLCLSVRHHYEWPIKRQWQRHLENTLEEQYQRLVNLATCFKVKLLVKVHDISDNTEHQSYHLIIETLLLRVTGNSICNSCNIFNYVKSIGILILFNIGHLLLFEYSCLF